MRKKSNGRTSSPFTMKGGVLTLAMAQLRKPVQQKHLNTTPPLRQSCIVCPGVSADRLAHGL